MFQLTSPPVVDQLFVQARGSKRELSIRGGDLAGWKNPYSVVATRTFRIRTSLIFLGGVGLAVSVPQQLLPYCSTASSCSILQNVGFTFVLGSGIAGTPIVERFHVGSSQTSCYH